MADRPNPGRSPRPPSGGGGGRSGAANRRRRRRGSGSGGGAGAAVAGGRRRRRAVPVAGPAPPPGPRRPSYDDADPARDPQVEPPAAPPGHGALRRARMVAAVPLVVAVVVGVVLLVVSPIAGAVAFVVLAIGLYAVLISDVVRVRRRPAPASRRRRSRTRGARPQPGGRALRQHGPRRPPGVRARRRPQRRRVRPERVVGDVGPHTRPARLAVARRARGCARPRLSHVKNDDIVPATVAATVALPLAAVWGGAAELVHRVAGRGRELQADSAATRVTRYPPGLHGRAAQTGGGPHAAARFVACIVVPASSPLGSGPSRWRRRPPTVWSASRTPPPCVSTRSAEL